MLGLLPFVNWYVAGMFDIFKCVRNGNDTCLSYILWSRPGSVTAKTTARWRPLHIAAYWGQAKIAERLIQAGAGVNVRNGYSRTPLHVAARRGHTKVVKILLEVGAKVDAKDWNAETPLHKAARGEAYPEAVEVLIKAGADINAKDNAGRTPLHWAALRGQSEGGKSLIGIGAELTASGMPLFWVPGGHSELAKILIDAGAEVNAKTRSGDTPLHWVASCGNTEILKVLIKAGVEPNMKNAGGETPLDRTKDKHGTIDPKKQDECADLLRKHGAKTGAELDAAAKQGKR